MTQDELACAAGIGRCFVNQIERGRFSVTLETVAVLSAALGIPPSQLIQSSNPTSD
jgi:transcriptional regulator with XRE-family HTH domain